MAKFPILTTERLMLREFRRSDAPAVFEIYSQDSVTQFVNRNTMHSIGEAKELVDIRRSLFGRKIGIRWGIVNNDGDGKIIGSCGYYNISKNHFSCEIGYELHPGYWRQGLMTEALTAAIDFAFGANFFINLNRIEALTFTHSDASIALLKKLKFREEGIRREYFYLKQRFHDIVCLSLLRKDWEGIR
jgi:ribosomal-protein-alanine N-acetyltransferase